MIYKFEGKNKEEALEKAIKELELTDGTFEVEVVSESKGLFKKNNVVINVHVDKNEEEIKLEDFNSQGIVDFVNNLIIKMGYDDVKTSILYFKNNKLCLNITCDNNSVLIGKKGKTLDAIQTIANIYGVKTDSRLRVVVDCENYRSRHEDYIIKNAFKSAKYVIKTGKSVLLEPLNPFERRLVHTSLSEFEGIQTISEGDGLIKQVRIIPTPKFD